MLAPCGSVEVRADTVNQLVALLHRAMSSLGVGASGGDAHASVAHSLLTLVEGCLRRLVLSRVRPGAWHTAEMARTHARTHAYAHHLPSLTATIVAAGALTAEVGLGAPEAAAGAEESKVAVEDAESKDDAADAEGMHPAVKLLYQQLRRILAPGAAFPPPLRRAADAALNAGLPVFFPDDSARRRVVEGMLGPAGGVVELQYNWPALSPDGGDDSRMERLLLLVQVKARRNGWKCRVMGKWLSLVHLVLELGDEGTLSASLSLSLCVSMPVCSLAPLPARVRSGPLAIFVGRPGRRAGAGGAAHMGFPGRQQRSAHPAHRAPRGRAGSHALDRPQSRLGRAARIPTRRGVVRSAVRGSAAPEPLVGGAVSGSQPATVVTTQQLNCCKDCICSSRLHPRCNCCTGGLHDAHFPSALHM